MQRSIAIVQTSAVSSQELKGLCSELLAGVDVIQIIDDSLIREVNANGGPTAGVRRRMYAYFRQAESMGVDLILNQCSSVGEVVDEIRPFLSTPVLKIDEPMARKAVETGERIGVIATVATTVGPSVRLIERAAREAGVAVRIEEHLVKDAMMILIERGDAKLHNEMVRGEVLKASQANDVIVLAQGSMTVLLPELTDVAKPVLSSPRLAVEHIRSLLLS
ncbi:MAG: aspartate/glutamate racemase family protein [Clostridia bacterium]|nr:aspartate/glutamate racemase family protein [Clostridia bacterium]